MDDDYLAQFTAAPAQLDQLFPHIHGELVAIRRSLFTNGQRRAALLAGSAVPRHFANHVAFVFAEFPDASGVERNVEPIRQYLARLVAPDHLADARSVICEELGIAEFEDTAASLEDLGALEPEITIALLELNPGRARELIAARMAALHWNSEERDELLDARNLIEEIGRIRIAYILRCEAMKAAAQIHTPLNWAALDGLEQPNAGGTLRLFTLLAAIQADLCLFERAMALYEAGRRNSIDQGVLACNALTRTGQSGIQFAIIDRPVDASEQQAFGHPDLERRARVQLALWRAEHGDELEDLLEAVVVRMRQEVARLKRGLTARARAGGNAIVGNMDRASAGVRLYFAVAEAVAWTIDPINAGRIQPDHPLNRLPLIKLLARQRWNKVSLRREDVTFPSLDNQHWFAETTDRLFMAMRFAFLQDNEALPIELRQIANPVTGKISTIKTHDKAARLFGRPYSFLEQWGAFEARQQRKLARLGPNAKAGQRCEARRIDYDIKRAALAARKLSGSQVARGTYAGQQAIRYAVLQGFAVR